MGPGGCYKELPLYKSVEELAKCEIPDLLAFLEEEKQHEQDMRDDYVQMFGEIKMRVDCPKCGTTEKYCETGTCIVEGKIKYGCGWYCPKCVDHVATATNNHYFQMFGEMTAKKSDFPKNRSECVLGLFCVDDCTNCTIGWKPNLVRNAKRDKMEEITIEKFYNLPEANDATAEDNQLYRNKGSVQPPNGSLKEGYAVTALRCVSITPLHMPQPPYTDAAVNYTLVELMLIDGESIDRPSPVADRIYWARNCVIMKCIRQALMTFQFELNSQNNRVAMGRMCTLRMREDYPDCNVECSCTPKQVDAGNQFTFTVTEGKLTSHYYAEFEDDSRELIRPLHITLTGEENSG